MALLRCRTLIIKVNGLRLLFTIRGYLTWLGIKQLILLQLLISWSPLIFKRYLASRFWKIKNSRRYWIFNLMGVPSNKSSLSFEWEFSWPVHVEGILIFLLVNHFQLLLTLSLPTTDRIWTPNGPKRSHWLRNSLRRSLNKLGVPVQIHQQISNNDRFMQRPTSQPPATGFRRIKASIQRDWLLRSMRCAT
jgi:hypothetical protein